MSEHKMNVLEAADRGRPVTIGRYVLQRQIARGGMATIHIGRLLGDEGFSRVVAAKRLLPEFAEDSEFVAMFLDEARIASKVHHRNVVPVLDVVTTGQEVVLVQDYVHGVPLHSLLKTMRNSKAIMPVEVAVAIACQVLAGLHATHETTDELGEPLHIVHRDVSPQNVMIATDGSARLLDFGVAKATMAAHVTREGTYKGKLAYSAPEQLRGAATRQSDVYSLSVLFWELLVGQRMHRAGKSGAELVMTVLNGTLPTIRDALTEEQIWDSLTSAERRKLQVLDPIVSKGLQASVRDRWATAAEMEEALMGSVRPAPMRAVAEWVRSVGKDFLEGREKLIAAEEASWRRLHPAISVANSSAPPSQGSFIKWRGRDVPVDINDGSLVFAPHLRERPKARMIMVGALIAAAMALGGALALWGKGRSDVAVVDRGAAAAARAGTGRVEAPMRGTSGAPLPQAARPVASEQGNATATQGAAPENLEQRNLLKAIRAEADRLARERKAEALSRESAAEEKRKLLRRPRAASHMDSEAERATAPSEATQSSQTANECDVPYYFEGSKKIFKPACI